MKYSRRIFLLAAGSILTGCASSETERVGLDRPAPSNRGGRTVDYETSEPAGTIIVEPSRYELLLIQGGGKALTYPVGVGKAGHSFSGRATVGRKEEWPKWTPTANMIAADPDGKGRLAGGVQGGAANPLGARALYLFQGGRDTLYRIHGTNDPSSIGKSVSSGCIRMFDRDVIDLYERVPIGAPVIVRG